MPSSIKARLKLFATADGGRQTPISSGYRPGFHLRPPEQFSGFIKLLDRGQLFPGEEAMVLIEFAFQDLTHNDLPVGKEIVFGESPRVLGRILVLQALE